MKMDKFVNIHWDDLRGEDIFSFQLNTVKGSGKYLATPCFAEYVYQRLHKREELREKVGRIG